MATSLRNAVLVTFCGGVLLCSAAPELASRSYSEAPGVSIPLFKRGSLTPEPVHSRVADWPAIQRHVEEVDAKYRRGMVNWQTNTGELDLWPVTAPSASQDASDASSSIPLASSLAAPAINTAVVTIPAAVTSTPSSSSAPDLDNLAPGQLAWLVKPVFDQFHFVQKTAVSTNTRGKRFARNRRGRKRQAEPLQDIQNDLLWAGIVNIGSDSQSFLIDIDTGSADFWVPSIKCESSQCDNHKLYDPTTSTTSKEIKDKVFKITYGDGSSSSGPVYTDAVTVAGLKADNQYFSAVTTVSDTFSSDPEDGILGMAYAAISELNKPPFFSSLVDQNKVQNAVFSFRLAKTGSELYLGGTNSAKYAGPIEWHPVTSQSYWLIVGSPLVNGKSITSNSTRTYNMAIDSGTTVIVAPIAEAKSFWKSVPGSAPYSAAPGYWTFPCKNPPTVAFTFSGAAGSTNKNWTIAPADFNLGATSAGSNSCVVGLNAWILGDAFMKNVYSVFDMDHHRIGFASPK